MKINKLSCALAALGIVSWASVAHATNPVIYLTGSTAARSVIANALTTSGDVFDAGTQSIVSPSPNNVAGGNLCVFEGQISGVTVDVDCSWTGSEAGIASISGQTLSQNVNSGTYNLPGSPASFLTQASGWTTQATQSPADLSMADTSQAVSQTSATLHPCVNYGRVGIVPFTAMKGYTSGASTSWTDLKNVTTAAINNAMSGPVPASFFTGNAADTDFVAITGRNFGSGTRANGLLNFQYAINTPVDQYAYAWYPPSTPGVLTFGNSTATNFVSGQSLVEVSNDGFDSGGGVANSLQVDEHGALLFGTTPAFCVGYVGISDAKNASIAGHGGTGAGAATYLPFNGVYESDSGVINGSYTYWGQEHLYGSPGQSGTSNAGKFAAKLVTGIATALAATGGSITDGTKAAGACTGDVSTNPSQSILIPVGLMQASRTQDGGFPTPAPF